MRVPRCCLFARSRPRLFAHNRHPAPRQCLAAAPPPARLSFVCSSSYLVFTFINWLVIIRGHQSRYDRRGLELQSVHKCQPPRMCDVQHRLHRQQRYLLPWRLKIHTSLAARQQMIAVCVPGALAKVCPFAHGLGAGTVDCELASLTILPCEVPASTKVLYVQCSDGMSVVILAQLKALRRQSSLRAAAGLLPEVYCLERTVCQFIYEM